MSWKHFWSVVTAAVFLPLLTNAAENLLPKVSTADKVWYSARNAACQAKFSCNEKDSVLSIEVAPSSGYANYRTDLKLKPGEYTVDVLINGNCEKKGIGVEIYSFDAAGKPRLLGMSRLEAGALNNERHIISFKVPEDSVSQRFGLCLNATGKVDFIAPAVYAGKLKAADLPERSAAASAASAAPAASDTQSDAVSGGMKNLLPKVTTVNKVWYDARNVECSAKFNCNEKSSTFNIEVTTATGYANYRTDLKLKPGEYTVDVLINGNCEKKGIGVEIYSFNAAGKPRLLMMSRLPEGRLANERHVATFKVPADSVSQRFGLCLNAPGRVDFVAPAVYAGKLKEGDLPERKGAGSGKKLRANYDIWVADWLWVKNANRIHKASFIKRFTIDKPVVAAQVQLSADNGYELKLNDQFVGADGDWYSTEKYDIAPLLRQGENVIEYIGKNYDGIGGLVLQGQIWFADGSTMDLLTRPDWELYINGERREDEKVVIGHYPDIPWVKLPFLRLAPLEGLALPTVKLVNNIAAGEIFALEVGQAGKVPEKELNELKFSFFDQNGRPVVLSQHVYPQVRRQGERLYVELETSAYAKPGVYRWRLDGIACEILPAGIEQKITVRPGVMPPGNPGVKYARYDGRNVMQGPDGKPMALMVYDTHSPSAQRYYNWRHTGNHMYEIHVQAGRQRPDGSFDLSDAERNMMQILAGDPDAGIYIKLRVDVPGWWNSRYPDEVFVSNRGRGALQSFCSDVWIEGTKKAMTTVMDELAARPVGKAIAGMLIMGYRGGEFQLWGEDVGEYDCSKPVKREFAKYLKKRGINETIELPHPALNRPFRKEPGDARVRELFFSFVAEKHAQNLVDFAKHFKDTYGDKYSYGIYFGYAMEHASSWTRMLFSGHIGVQKVLDEAPLDLISSPCSYGLRRPHSTHAFMYPQSAAQLRGIRGILENDIRNYVYPLHGDGSGTTIYSMRDSLINDSRLALFGACYGAVIRYLAIDDQVDFFTGLPAINQIAKDNLRNIKLEPAELGCEGQLAWAIAPDTWAKVIDSGFTEKKWGDFTCYGRDTVMRSGRSVAFVMVDDVIKNPGKWSNVGIPAPALLKKEQLAALEKQFGKLPELKPDTGALVIIDGKISLADTREELWKAIATDQAKAAGMKTVWYVGGNFVGTWDQKEFKYQINQ